jgi:hypothetical protein
MRTSDWFGIAAIGFLIDTPFAHLARPLTHSSALSWGHSHVELPASRERLFDLRHGKVDGPVCKFRSPVAAHQPVMISYAMDRSQEFLSIWVFGSRPRGCSCSPRDVWHGSDRAGKEKGVVRNIAFERAAVALAQRLKTELTKRTSSPSRSSGAPQRADSAETISPLASQRGDVV